MVEEKARVVLARSEFTSFCYYMDEYTARHMSIEAFVQVILEMLNTPEKVRITFLVFLFYHTPFYKIYGSTIKLILSRY